MTTEAIPEHVWKVVLAVDPGTTTGIALLGLDQAYNGRPMAFWGAQLDWQEACAAVERRLELIRRKLDSGEAADAAAVCEKFTVNPQTAQRGQQGIADAFGLIGVVRRNCLLTGVTFHNAQDASSAKSLVKDPALKEMGLFAPGLKHVNDAYRHAVTYAVRVKWMQPRYLLGEGR